MLIYFRTWTPPVSKSNCFIAFDLFLARGYSISAGKGPCPHFPKKTCVALQRQEIPTSNFPQSVVADPLQASISSN
jgi:hypothetical protein